MSRSFGRVLLLTTVAAVSLVGGARADDVPVPTGSSPAAAPKAATPDATPEATMGATNSAVPEAAKLEAKEAEAVTQSAAPAVTAPTLTPAPEAAPAAKVDGAADTSAKSASSKSTSKAEKKLAKTVKKSEPAKTVKTERITDENAVPSSVSEVRAAADKSIKEFMPEEQAGDTDSLFSRSLVMAYEGNPNLKAARAQLQSVFESLPQAEAGWRPTVTGSADVTSSHSNMDPGSSSNNTAKDGAVAVVQNLYAGGQTVANTAAAKNTIRAQIASLESTEQSVMLQAATAYMNLLRDEALYKLALNNRTVIKRQKDATDERFKVGELTRTDVSQAEARYASADADVITAQANLSTSKAVYEQVVGVSADDKLLFPSSKIDLPSSLDDALVLAEKWNPDIRSSQHLLNAAQDSVKSKYGQLLPDVSVKASASKAYDPTTSINSENAATVGVVATIPLYEAGVVRSQIRQAKHVANQRYEQMAATGRATREQVVSNWENLKAAEAEIAARRAQVQASEVARFGVHQEASLGSRTVLDTLNADQEVRDAQAALITAKRNEVVARFTLASALGLLTPKNLGFSDKVPNYDRAIQAVRHNFFGTDVDSLH